MYWSFSHLPQPSFLTFKSVYLFTSWHLPLVVTRVGRVDSSSRQSLCLPRESASITGTSFCSVAPSKYPECLPHPQLKPTFYTLLKLHQSLQACSLLSTLVGPWPSVIYSLLATRVKEAWGDSPGLRLEFRHYHLHVSSWTSHFRSLAPSVLLSTRGLVASPLQGSLEH